MRKLSQVLLSFKLVHTVHTIYNKTFLDWNFDGVFYTHRYIVGWVHGNIIFAHYLSLEIKVAKRFKINVVSTEMLMGFILLSR